MNRRTNLLPVFLLTSLFFLWGFAHNLDPILIPHLKRSFTLSTVQATLVDTAVYAAYFIVALPAGLIMKRYGYKNGIIAGLVLFATGCYLFLPAAGLQSYNFFLIALFIIACGLTILETVANPYMTLLGDPQNATQRLNFAQSFNGFATALAPLAGTKLILIQSQTDEQLQQLPEMTRKALLAAEASSVKLPYFVLGTVLLMIALAFTFTKMPDVKGKQGDGNGRYNIISTLKHLNLRLSVVAQFFYVGAQTCVLSLFVLYATTAAGITQQQAGYFASVCGFAFLAGRFAGTFLMRYIKAGYLLATYAAINVFLSLIAINAHGIYAVYIVIAISFFMSIMFPTIFALGIQGLGADRELGSSLIIMSIVGGAVIPRIYGYISDATGDIRSGYYVPAACFIIIAIFGLAAQRTRIKPESIPVNTTY